MKNYFKLMLAMTMVVIVVVAGCQKDDSIVKVDGIDVTIPRILLKDGKITMFISVTDLKGNAISGISSGDIMIESIKDGKISKISGFNLYSSTGIPTPIAAALTMDYSGSMYYDTAFVPAMESAVKTFISLKGLTDKLEIIKFDQVVYVVQAFTADTLLLFAAVDSVMSLGGSTAFYKSCLDGLVDAAAEVANNTGVLPAVVGFTDGVNNVSPMVPDTVISHALQSQIPIYTVGFGGTPSYMPDTSTLRHIADTTGGRYYWTPDPTDVQQLYQYINGQLTGAMVVGFPWGSKANAIIRVTVKYQGFTARAEKMIYY